LTAAGSGIDLRIVEPSWDHRPGAKGRGSRKLQRATWEAGGFAARAARLRPDLLHIPSMAAPLLAPAPFVVTIHDAIPFQYSAYRASAAMRAHLAMMTRTVRAARLVIAPSQSAARDIVDALGIDAERIRVVHEAADPACAPADDPAAVRPVLERFGIHQRYIFNVGGLDVRKNVPLLIDAFARLRPLLPDPVQLVIAGAAHSDNPSVFPPIAPIIDRLGLRDVVVLTGRVSEADKLALYQGAALYVTPSYAEGFGLTALEAMACGVPTIAANRTSFPEVVRDGGLLAEVDADSLVTLMRLVLDNPAVAADLRARGIARSAQFSWRRAADETIAVYREVLRDERG
jgi:glycosyltransferase involved in cell wall biosynthesis